MKPQLEELESRSVPSVSLQRLGSILQVFGDPRDNHVAVLTQRQLAVDGKVTEIGADIRSLNFGLGDGANVLLNYSAFPTLVVLGRGTNTVYGGRGPDLVQMFPGVAPHGLDVVVDPYGANAIDVRGGPSFVLTNPETAVAADYTSEVFRILAGDK